MAVPTLKELLNTIDGFVVGGAVRDIYLGKTPHDYDVITALTPSEIRERVEIAHSIGEKYGTLCVATADCGIVEVTTMRSDMTPGRKPEVCWTTSIHDDLHRRDFTINNLFMESTGCIQGYDQSHDDIKNGIIRCVGSASDRLNEDTLRALRAIRFKLQLKFEISPDLKRELHGFDLHIGTQLSGTRVMDELRKMFTIDACAAISQLNYYDLLYQIFPEMVVLHQCLENPKWHPDERTTFIHTLRALERAQEYSFEVQLATALHDIGKGVVRHGDSTKYYGHAEAGARLIDNIADRLLWSNALRDSCKFVCANHMKMHVVEEMRPHKRKLIYDSPHFDTLFKVHKCDAGERTPAEHFQWILDDAASLRHITPIVSGDIIVSYGIKGKDVGVYKQRCFAAQLSEQFTSIDGGIKYLKGLIND